MLEISVPRTKLPKAIKARCCRVRLLLFAASCRETSGVLASHMSEADAKMAGLCSDELLSKEVRQSMVL